MRAVVALLITGALFHSTARAQTSDVQMPELQEELIQRVAEDQAIRKELLDAGMEQPDMSLLAEMRAIDSANTVRMKEIVKKHGFPGRDLVGREGADAAFLLIQHADSAFQSRVLPEVEEAYEQGDLEGQSYALLLDRVLVQQGKGQVYGTQIKPMHMWESGPEPYPIENRAEVDARRAAVGLPPLEAYMKMIQDMYKQTGDDN